MLAIHLTCSLGRCEAYLATAHYTLVLVVAKGALVTYSDQSCGADVTVAYWAFAITLVAETSNGYA